MESVYLQGSEDVSRAGYTIASAAETISRAAMSFDSAAERLIRTLDEHACRVETAMAVPTPRRCMVSKLDWSVRPAAIVERGPGLFIRWGEHSDPNEGHLTVAVVEFPDGSVDTVLPHFIKFEVPA